MNDPCLPENEFQPFILSKDRKVLVRLSNHVQFVRAAPNPYEEVLSNKEVLGHNGHFCLLWVISNCANKLWATSHQKVLDIQKIERRGQCVTKFEMDSWRNKFSKPLHTEKCHKNAITYHKKLGACFLCTQKHVKINIYIMAGSCSSYTNTSYCARVSLLQGDRSNLTILLHQVPGTESMCQKF